jgi:hypothetical protein
MVVIPRRRDAFTEANKVVRPPPVLFGLALETSVLARDIVTYVFEEIRLGLTEGRVEPQWGIETNDHRALTSTTTCCTQARPPRIDTSAQALE